MKTTILIPLFLALVVATLAAKSDPCEGVAGKRHRNPDKSVGGFVAETAQVAEGAHVDRRATVCGNARVESGARIEDRAVVTGDAVIGGGARIAGQAKVGENAQVIGAALVTGRAKITGSAVVSENAVVFGLARVKGSSAVSGEARVGGTARVTEGSVTGDVDLGTAKQDIADIGAALAKLLETKKNIETSDDSTKPHRMVQEYSDLRVEGEVMSFDYSHDLRQYTSQRKLKSGQFYRKTTDEFRINFTMHEVAEVRIDSSDGEELMVWIRMQRGAHVRLTRRKQSEIHLPTTRRKSKPKDAVETDIFITFAESERKTLVPKFLQSLSRAVAIAQGMQIPE